MTVTHLPVVVPEFGDPPEDISVGHPMRAITEAVAADPAAWTPEVAREVSNLFEEISGDWTLVHAPERIAPLLDVLDRGGPFAEPVVEVGAGAGAGTAVLAEHFDAIVATDLVPSMLVRIGVDVPCAAVDAHDLSFADGSIGTLVCVNAMLFPDEVRRVLSRGGSLVWVNTIGEITPIHLSADAVATALGDGFELVASRAAWGSWAVARRTAV